MATTPAPFTPQELAGWLNAMLEAERAGARALLEFLGEHERRSEAWTVLRRVQAEEAHNCAMIGGELKRLGVPYSHANGKFLDKALAVQGRKARLVYLVRGLRWAVREFEAALPRIEDTTIKGLVARMRDSHLASIAACEGLSAKLAD